MEMLMDTQPQVSASVPDWTREERQKWWDPSRQLLYCIRRYQYWRYRFGIAGRAISRWYALRHRFWSVVTGADIPVNTLIGGGVLLPHPIGIVIHPNAEIGPNCLIFQQVTLGTGNRKKPGIPRIGGHVDIGAGAKILGGIVIGDHARIGANSVVMDDVPSGRLAVGVPARLKP